MSKACFSSPVPNRTKKSATRLDTDLPDFLAYVLARRITLSSMRNVSFVAIAVLQSNDVYFLTAIYVILITLSSTELVGFVLGRVGWAPKTKPHPHPSFPLKGREIVMSIPLQAVRQGHGPERCPGGGQKGDGLINNIATILRRLRMMG